MFQLEESADVLRRRVELLEEEAAAKPVVDVGEFAALQEEAKAAAAVGEGLRAEVSECLFLPFWGWCRRRVMAEGCWFLVFLCLFFFRCR